MQCSANCLTGPRGRQDDRDGYYRPSIALKWFRDFITLSYFLLAFMTEVLRTSRL